MIQVRKLNGQLEPYDEQKLKRSLISSGADEETAKRLIAAAQKILYDGIETKKLYKFVLEEFKKHVPVAAAKYALKNAILRLGPEGFAFEQLVAAIFQKKGYITMTDQHVQGKHIMHEIDIIAENKKERLMIECKYHERPWVGSHIHVALYTYARFLDVQQSFSAPALVTNTKFSTQITQYAHGVGLRLMGWKFPERDSLEYNIEKFKLYPITMLQSMDSTLAASFLEKRIVLIETFAGLRPEEMCARFHLSEKKARAIVSEAKLLLSA